MVGVEEASSPGRARVWTVDFLVLFSALAAARFLNLRK
jgi:hypothetical protein